MNSSNREKARRLESYLAVDMSMTILGFVGIALGKSIDTEIIFQFGMVLAIMGLARGAGIALIKKLANH